MSVRPDSTYSRVLTSTVRAAVPFVIALAIGAVVLLTKPMRHGEPVALYMREGRPGIVSASAKDSV